MNHKDTILMLVVFLAMGALAVLLFVVPKREADLSSVNLYKDIDNTERIVCGQKELVLPLKGEKLESVIDGLLSQDRVIKMYQKDVENFGVVKFVCYYSFVPKDSSVDFSSDVESFFAFEDDGGEVEIELISKIQKGNAVEMFFRMRDASSTALGKMIGENNNDGSYSIIGSFAEEQEILNYKEENALKVFEVPFIRSAQGVIYSDSDIESSIVEHKGQFVCGDKVLRGQFPVTRMLLKRRQEENGVYADNWFSLTTEKSGVGVTCYHIPNDGTVESLGKDWYKNYHFDVKNITNTEFRKDGIIVVDTKSEDGTNFSRSFYFIDNFGAGKTISVGIINEEKSMPEWGKKMFDSISMKDVFSQ